MFRKVTILMMLCVFQTGCYYRVPKCIQPSIQFPPHPKEIQKEKRISLSLPENFSLLPFSPLSPEEKETDWGKEYRIALLFAEDFDLYRAITGFKRALYLIPNDLKGRSQEIQYMIALAYYLGRKYTEVIYIVDSTDLGSIDSLFPAYSDLLLILYDSYYQLGKTDHASHVLNLIEIQDSEIAHRLTILEAIKKVDLNYLSLNPAYRGVFCGYHKAMKSIQKAEIFNAIMPGAGYWYIGMRQTAVTAFLVNALFIGAAAHFLHEGNIAAGVITLSFEGGWYFGGISGAGLAAKRYNEQLYCSYVGKIIQREELFPFMMLKYSF
ncbi:MAG: hypothetical protein R3E91_03820 [Chlamydiales bacterium]